MDHDVHEKFALGRRRMLGALATGLAGAALPAGVLAQSQASKSALRIVYPFAPGGEWDGLLRAISQNMSQQLKMPALVENRPGGSGRIGMNYLLKQDPGFNLFMAPIAQLVFVPIVQPTTDYDTQRDLIPVTQVATYDSCIAAHPGIGVNNLAEFVGWVKKNPAKASCGLSGQGGLHHFIAIALQKAVNIDFQFVFYKGGGQLRTDLLAGHVPFTFGTVADMIPMHRSGKVRIISTSGTTRNHMVPDVPTYREQGQDFVAQGWYGLFAPIKTPPAMLKTMEEASVAALKEPGVRKLILDIGSTPAAVPGSAALRNIVKTDFERWVPIIKASGFKLEE